MVLIQAHPQGCIVLTSQTLDPLAKELSTRRDPFVGEPAVDIVRQVRGRGVAVLRLAGHRLKADGLQGGGGYVG